MRKPAFCICENKDPDQLRGNREADQRLRPVATDLKVVRRKLERVPTARVGGEHERGVSPPSCKGGSGDLPRENFDIWLPLYAFLMHFGCVLGQFFQPFWLRSIETVLVRT